MWDPLDFTTLKTMTQQQQQHCNYIIRRLNPNCFHCFDSTNYGIYFLFFVFPFVRKQPQNQARTFVFFRVFFFFIQSRTVATISYYTTRIFLNVPIFFYTITYIFIRISNRNHNRCFWRFDTDNRLHQDLSGCVYMYLRVCTYPCICACANVLWL